jgi:Flp pilus assembly protein TadG
MVLFALFLVPLLACVALAIDVGMLTMAETQLHDAADAAAMAGARALNGNTTGSANNNYSAVLPTATGVVAGNKVLGTAIQASQLTLNIGCYSYNSTAQQFQGQFPTTLPANTNWDMVQATISLSPSSSMGFSKVFSYALPNLQATATAAHCPRDISLILDFSGSMRFSSLLGLDYETTTRTSNNMDTTYPQFGAYSSATLSNDVLASSPASPYQDANISRTTSDGRPPIIQDFFSNSTGTPAFTYASSNYCTTPGGDNCLKTMKNVSSGTYAQTLAQVLNIGSVTLSTVDTKFQGTATVAGSGYTAYGMTPKFNRYTQGPGYWGKTFFIWPPDPSKGSDGTTNDWRQRYFTYPSSTNPMTDNSKLWDSSGNWQTPGSTTYNVNYTAILNFISNIGPNPFPAQLQSGNIVYYTTIPTTINTSVWPPTDLNQRFWKDYIDYVLGFMQTGSNSWVILNNGSTGYAGYGADDVWGTVKITPQSSLTGNPTPYMYYGDNPQRPLLHFWFGPMTMIDFLGNYNLWYTGYYNDCTRYCWWPGTCHEAPLYACKLGIQAALTDISNNHPNDLVSLIMFSTPLTSATDTSASRFNRVRVGLGQSYSLMQDSLWFPPAAVGSPTTTVTPYDSNNLEVPRAMGGTCYAYPLMLAFNQFSSNTSLQTYNTGKPAGDAGGNGRIGAQKIIIFETDGAPNTTASAAFNSSGSCQSYYSVRYNSNNPSGSDYPSAVNGYANNDPTVTAQIYSICTQLAASTSAGGYTTTNKPLLIHCLVFGPLGAAATPTLIQMQTIGNVFDNMPAYKIINGNASTIIANLQTAINTILQDGVQVSLIQ